MSVSSCGSFKCPSRSLENIEEDEPASWVSETCAPPETPIESMEFLARSWSLSAMELAKALAADNLDKYEAFCSVGNEAEVHVACSVPCCFCTCHLDQNMLCSYFVGVVTAVYCDIPAWPGREREESCEQRAYFGVKTDDRIIEFECRNKGDKQMWTEGIQHMLHCRTNMI